MIGGSRFIEHSNFDDSPAFCRPQQDEVVDQGAELVGTGLDGEGGSRKVVEVHQLAESDVEEDATTVAAVVVVVPAAQSNND